MALYDINCHLLPGIDGGPDSLDDSFDLLVNLARSGIEGVVAAPDQRDVMERSDVRDLDPLMNRLRRMVSDNRDLFPSNIRLRLGMENHLALDLPMQYRAGNALPIAGTRFILVRLPFNWYPPETESVLSQLRVLHLNPLISHPERNVVLQKDWQRLAMLVNEFNYVQISAGSICGMFGDAARAAAEEFVNRGIAHVVGSEMRVQDGALGVSLATAYQSVKQFTSEQHAIRLFETNPARMFSGAPPNGNSTAIERYRPSRLRRTLGALSFSRR